jgi:hypothetical protein
MYIDFKAFRPKVAIQQQDKGVKYPTVKNVVCVRNKHAIALGSGVNMALMIQYALMV